jgi:N6-adenosine-specific RNA methylase IME4
MGSNVKSFDDDDDTASQSLTTQVRRHVTSVPQALAALARMEAQLGSAKTYDSLRRIEKEAKALGILLDDVREVKEQSQLVLVLAKRRIGEEMKRVPKAVQAGPGRGRKQSRKPAKSFTGGRAATGVKKDSRARMAKLTTITEPDLRAIVGELHKTGKDATEGAVLAVLKEREIRESRKSFEARRDKGSTIGDLAALARSDHKFKVIYADPPWEFDAYSGKGKQRSAERRYDTMTLDEIKALPVADLADKDCVLFLWTVCPEQPGAHEVIKAWGFEFKTVAFVWLKSTGKAESIDLNGGGLDWGMGNWTRANVELVLMGIRGKPQRIAKDVHQVVIAPVTEHSEKPKEVHRRIERLLNGDYIELFARCPVEGWTTWGNEVKTAARPNMN